MVFVVYEGQFNNPKSFLLKENILTELFNNYILILRTIINSYKLLELYKQAIKLQMQLLKQFRSVIFSVLLPF